MNLLVYDIAATDGGGLFVLKQFYADVVRLSPASVSWTFLVSQPGLESTATITVLTRPDLKRSWFHRLWFEQTELPRLIRDMAPDLVISLQNMPLARCRCPQFVYLQQSLPFCPRRFSFFRKEERSLAVRQHLIGALCRRSLPRATRIFVQTQWMKEATVAWISCQEDKVSVVPVLLDAPPAEFSYQGHHSRVFFYPARGEMYKNHAVVIEACRHLAAQGITDYKVIFTIQEQDSAYAAQLVKAAQGLPIAFVGTLSPSTVWEHYRQSVLLFPSYLETCGLPLLEMRSLGGRILAVDLPFAHEALDGYPYADFFPYTDAKSLAAAMKTQLDGNNSLCPAVPTPAPRSSGEGLAAHLLQQAGVSL